MNLEEKIIKLTSSFEGSGFNTLTGNFDGAGISFGIIQFNFGMGTLQPLIREFYKQGPGTFRRLCTINGKSYSHDLLVVCEKNMPNQIGLNWSKTIQKKNLLGKWKINPEWVQIFTNLASNEVYKHIQLKFVEDNYMARAKKDCKKFGILTERALSLFFDIAVQNGGFKPYHKLLMKEHTLAEVAKAVAQKSNIKWQKDVLDRKMCIVNGYGFVHGRQYIINVQYQIGDRPISL